MKKTLTFIILTVLVILLFAGIARAESKVNLDKSGRYGCLACHGDKRLTMVKNGKTVSIYVNENEYMNSVHAKISCISCHTDFTFRDHSQGIGGNWQKTAGLSCIRCKQHNKQYKLYVKSIHGSLAMSNDKKKGATCGDCHAYKIHSVSKNDEFKKDFFFNAKEVCGKSGCHSGFYMNYADYYHGAAYKDLAADSPACWTCHSTHDIAPKNSVKSQVNDENIGATCGKCHPGSENTFGIEYKQLIHGTQKWYDVNVVVKYAGSLSGIKDTAVSGSVNAYKRATGWIVAIYETFFPPSARPLKE